jgi:hypothetical protein
MALIKIIPPGPVWPPVHKRGYKLIIVKGRLLIKKKKQIKAPKADKPPAAQEFLWGSWWLKVRRRYTGLFGHDWNTADLPQNKPYWEALAAAVQIPNYKGNLVTVNGFEWWMWYTWTTMVASNFQRFPYDPVGVKPYWYPRLPWNPPATPDAHVTRNNSPSDFEVTYDYLPSQSDYYTLICFWLGRHPATQNNVQPSHFVEWWATTYNYQVGGIRVPYDFSALIPSVRPGESAVIGWAIFIQQQNVAGVWTDIYQVTPRRWLHFNFA